MSSRAHLPLVYSCSGCSSAAQMANYLAVALDRRGFAEMSCIAGVGGDVPKLVRVAKSGRRIIAIDGCALACVRNCLARHGIEPSDHHLLSDHGVRKRYQTDFDMEEAELVLAELATAIASAECAPTADRQAVVA
ncbi:putative zinc-binding protein [Methylocella sp.]|uniref:putative zinc-binding protein n=1 Tax=Methylocella sp. TaxID=1978226 RepID=UPI003783C451